MMSVNLSEKKYIDIFINKVIEALESKKILIMNIMRSWILL